MISTAMLRLPLTELRSPAYPAAGELGLATPEGAFFPLASSTRWLICLYPVSIVIANSRHYALISQCLSLLTFRIFSVISKILSALCLAIVLSTFKE